MKRKSRQNTVSQDRIALFLFMVFLVAVIFILDSANNSGQTVTSDELISKLVASGNEQNSVAFVVEDKVDSSKLMQFANTDYAELKKELGVDYDFTLYFEDQQGNVVPIGDRYCIGSGRAKVAGLVCG